MGGFLTFVLFMFFELSYICSSPNPSIISFFLYSSVVISTIFSTSFIPINAFLMFSSSLYLIKKIWFGESFSSFLLHFYQTYISKGLYRCGYSVVVVVIHKNVRFIVFEEINLKLGTLMYYGFGIMFFQKIIIFDLLTLLWKKSLNLVTFLLIQIYF